MFSLKRASAGSWRTVCGLERYGNTARTPLVAVGHMTLVFRWPRRTVFKIISFLSLCFTLFYNWPSSSPTPRAHDWWVHPRPPHRQEPSLPPLQGRPAHQQLVSPFGSKLWNLPCSRVFLKSAVVFLFRLSYHLVNGEWRVFYLLPDCMHLQCTARSAFRLHSLPCSNHPIKIQLLNWY